MKKDILAVFWAPQYRRFSSADIGTECESEGAALADLYNRIVAESGPVSYINNIYDNAEVEIEPDNMEEIVVRDHYDLCMVYAKQNANAGDGAASLTLYPEGPARNPVGMLYVRRPIEGSGPDFEGFLLSLRSR